MSVLERFLCTIYSGNFINVYILIFNNLLVLNIIEIGEDFLLYFQYVEDVRKENANLEVELAQDIDIKYKGQLGANPHARKRSTVPPGFTRWRSRLGNRAYVPSRREWEWNELMNRPWKRSSMRSEETVKAMHDGSPWLFEKEPFKEMSRKRDFVVQRKGDINEAQLKVNREYN